MAKPGIDSKTLKPAAPPDPDWALRAELSKLTWGQLTPEQKDSVMRILAERYHLILKAT